MSLHSATFSLSNEYVEKKDIDFGNLLFIQRKIGINKMIDIISNLAEKNEISIEQIPALQVVGNFSLIQNIPSKRKWGYLRHNWPTKYVEFRLSNAPNLPAGPLSSKDFDLFPDGRKAVVNLLQLTSLNPDSCIWIQIPNYRARITDLKIYDKKIQVDIETLNLDPKSIGAKIYYDLQEPSSFISEEKFISFQTDLLDFKNNSVVVENEDEFNYLLVAIIDKFNKSILDYREFYSSWIPGEGVIIQHEELNIYELLRRGEDIHCEFKQKIDDEFLETIVSFSNTEGGYILLGVADDSTITGFEKKNENQIINLITSNIEPEPEVEEFHHEIDGKPILLLTVNEGDDKPYAHRQKGVYIRSGSTDRRAIGLDLDIIYKKKLESKQTPR
jgi:hypothetical protein